MVQGLTHDPIQEDGEVNGQTQSQGGIQMMRRKLFSLVGIVLLVLAGACAKKEEQPKPEEMAPAAQAVAPLDTATAATIGGKVILEGAPPPNKVINMKADPKCAALHKTPSYFETVVVGPGGALQNVFVYVKEGLGNRTFPVPQEPVVLDQEGCHYTPHVFGVRAGQPIKIVNSDPTLHNIHPQPTKNPGFNIAQPVKGMESIKTFNTPEVMIPVKCDVHGWMSCYIGVMNHPYFAVSGQDGNFTLSRLPPGTYLIEAWHEKYGTQTQSVTVGPKETKEIQFTFKASAPAA